MGSVIIKEVCRVTRKYFLSRDKLARKTAASDSENLKID